VVNFDALLNPSQVRGRLLLTKQLIGPFTALVVCAHSAPLHFCTNNQRCKRPLIAALAVKIFLKEKIKNISNLS